jgi:hypothetical protein
VNKKQLGSLLGAATITGLVVIMLLLLGGHDAAVGTEPATTSAADSASAQVVPFELYNQLQDENAQLQQNMRVMLLREAQYQAQLNLANQRLQRQGQAVPSDRQSFVGEGFENEGLEHEGLEHEAGDF